MVCFWSGFHTGRGVAARGCIMQSLRPAMAEPSVPSAWKVTRSSRCTRVVHDMLIWAITPPSSWKVA